VSVVTGIGRYREVGQGRPVVILSNPQADPGWWAVPLVAALAGAGYRVVTFVHGGSDHSPDGVVADVSALLDRLGDEPVRVLGWSQGAAIAQEVALRRPDRVVAAALIAGYGRQNSADRSLQEAWQVLDTAGPELDPVRLVMLMLTSYPPEMLGNDAFLDPLLPGLRQWSAGTGSSSPARSRSREFIDGYQERLGALAEVRVPCLVIGFEQDADTFVVRAREVAAAIPGSRYLELPGAGHLTPVTQPERVVTPILQFFREIDER
jgi:pimeloyl-ACP methyl ester carboxylesterase